MPIYEYECSCCSSHFELKQGFQADTQAPCPQCGGDSRRIFLPAPIIFKGSGFYVTDSRGNHGHPETAGGSSGTKTDNAKADSTKESVKTGTTEKDG